MDRLLIDITAITAALKEDVKSINKIDLTLDRNYVCQSFAVLPPFRIM